MTVSIHVDAVNRLFICTYSGESRVLDFSTVQSNANALAGRLSRNDLLIGIDELASRTAFEKYQVLLSLAAKQNWSELWYDPRVSISARQALQSAKVTGRKVRIFYGNAATGQDSLMHKGVVGWIGGLRVDGLPRVGLSEHQGQPAGHRVHELDVVRVVDIGSFVDVYRHSNYHLPKVEVLESLTGAHQLRVDDVPLFEAEHKAILTKWQRFFCGVTHETPQLIPTYFSGQ